MLHIQNILFPTDFSACSEHAFQHAAHLCRTYDARLHVFNTVVTHHQAIREPARAPVHFPYDVEGLNTVEASARHTSAAEGILTYIDRHDIDLVVMGTHGWRGMDRLVMGSVAAEVVRMAPCPVLTIRSTKDSAPLPVIDRILAPVDFSEHAQLALRYVNELAHTYGARVQILHVIEEAVLPTVYGLPTPEISVPSVKARTLKALQDLVRTHLDDDLKADVEVRVGHAPRDILDWVEHHDTNLVVLASHGLRGLQRLLLGSVTEKVVRMAACPVFTVKSFGKSLLAQPASSTAASEAEAPA